MKNIVGLFLILFPTMLSVAQSVHPDVAIADTFHIENYTVPSYMPMWMAREKARRDPSEKKLEALQTAIANLQSKYEPYCVVATLNGDPKTNMGFCWFTNEGVEDGAVELTDEEGMVTTLPATPTTTKSLRYAVPVSGIMSALDTNASPKFKYVSHKVLATDLKPGTVYTYRVGYEGHWSQPFSFTTEKDEQGDFSFIYMSDSHIQNQVYVDEARQCALAAAKNEQDIVFCAFPGDFVETGTAANSEWEWERWFEEAIKPVIEKMPIVPTDGNHDDSNNLNYTLHFNTDNAFNLISQVKPQFDGITYSFMYGDVLFLVYSKQDYWRGRYSYKKQTCDYLTNDVGNWFIDQVAAHPEAKWRVALVHKNIFSGSDHSLDEETPMFRTTMLPIMRACEIDLVLQGHDHCYEVMGPVDSWTRQVVPGSVTDTIHVKGGRNSNMTGIEGGTFCTDDGTLYFIGATCGHKRYYPYNRAKMEANENITLVHNYFDLFTSRFGQPDAPCYTRVNVSDTCMELITYMADAEGTSTPFNTIRVVRTKEHAMHVGLNEVRSLPKNAQGVYDLMGRRYDAIPGQGVYIVVTNQGTKKIHVQ